MQDHERREERADLILLVAVPIVALWLLLIFAPRSDALSMTERIGFGVLFSVTYGPLMTMRIRNR